jgi:hypothetical protein
MTRILLRIHISPGQAEVFINLKAQDGIHRRRIAAIDTGAAISLLPNALMDVLDYRLSGNETITIDQAGIAKQAFHATEAYVTLYLEDWTGLRTEEFEARVWFADTNRILIGFEGILDRAVLHVDMPNRTGYLEFT